VIDGSRSQWEPGAQRSIQAVEKRDLLSRPLSFVIAAFCMYASLIRIRHAKGVACVSLFFTILPEKLFNNGLLSRVPDIVHEMAKECIEGYACGFMKSSGHSGRRFKHGPAIGHAHRFEEPQWLKSLKRWKWSSGNSTRWRPLFTGISHAAN